MMSIMDEAVYACDIREPRHAPSEEKHLDAPDRKRLEERAHTEMVPLFGLKG
ncbi:MAG: hypothetical protein LUO93_00710 [Methanomicrobiales archaeon]|nr:hypothetical protein [Methanomicrobiales archaeon]